MDLSVLAQPSGRPGRKEIQSDCAQRGRHNLREASMAERENGSVSNERWENLRRHQQPEASEVGKRQRLLSGLAGMTLMALTLRTKRLRPFLFPLATGLIAKALTGRAGKQKLSDMWNRKGDRVSRVASV